VAVRLRADIESRQAAPLEVPGLMEALRALPVAQRKVVVLHHLLDLPVEQVAAELGVPTGTVKSRLARARISLAARLAPGTGAEGLRDQEGAGNHG
jgi:RNA polymerase sigma factor (sigma-70 family)